MTEPAGPPAPTSRRGARAQLGAHGAESARRPRNFRPRKFPTAEISTQASRLRGAPSQGRMPGAARAAPRQRPARPGKRHAWPGTLAPAEAGIASLARLGVRRRCRAARTGRWRGSSPAAGGGRRRRSRSGTRPRGSLRDRPSSARPGGARRRRGVRELVVLRLCVTVCNGTPLCNGIYW